jgi:ankyrin repeat protein
VVIASTDTPLIWACIEGRVEAVRVLLEHGADVTAVNHYGAPALLCAVMIGENPDEDDSDHHRAEILRLLLDKCVGCHAHMLVPLFCC